MYLHSTMSNIRELLITTQQSRGGTLGSWGFGWGETKSLKTTYNLEQGWANFSVQGPHSKIHNFIGPHSILTKIIDIKYIK